MHDPESYNKNDYPKQVAQDFLTKYGKMCKWKRGSAIIDIGCGPGFITSNILTRHIPKDFRKITGVDISQDMVNFANKHYANERVQFSTLDIAGPIPNELKRSFQHAISFLCLHWVNDQRQAFQNIHDMLTDDGNCFVTLVQRSNFYEMAQILAHSDKWKNLAGRTAIEHISKYHNTKTPEKDLRNVLKATGFKEIFIENKRMPQSYDHIQSLKDFALSLNLLKLPEHLLEEFGLDVIRVMSDMRLVEPLGSGTRVVLNNTSIMFAYASK